MRYWGCIVLGKAIDGVVIPEDAGSSGSIKVLLTFHHNGGPPIL